MVGQQAVRLVDAEEGALQRHALAAGEGQAVAVAAAPGRAAVALAEGRHADDAGNRPAGLQHRTQPAEAGRAGAAGLAALLGLDHPTEILAQALPAVHLPEAAVAGETATEDQRSRDARW